MLTGPHFSADPPDPRTARELRHRLEDTRARITAAALRCGRRADAVGLVAISKRQPAESLRILAECGQRDFGENYLQEALPKLAALEELALVWHYTGQLQANKTRPVAEHFQWVHTVDRERVAVRLNEQRPHYAAPLNVCIQVRLADEPGKGGVVRTEVESLARRVLQLPRLKLRGLMCLPPPRPTFEEQRALFAQLAECMRELNERGMQLDTLSMGMSADLEAAVAAGATWVRIGTAIFGERTRQ